MNFLIIAVIILQIIIIFMMKKNKEKENKVEKVKSNICIIATFIAMIFCISVLIGDNVKSLSNLPVLIGNAMGITVGFGIIFGTIWYLLKIIDISIDSKIKKQIKWLAIILALGGLVILFLSIITMETHWQLISKTAQIMNTANNK